LSSNNFVALLLALPGTGKTTFLRREAVLGGVRLLDIDGYKKPFAGLKVPVPHSTSRDVRARMRLPYQAAIFAAIHDAIGAKPRDEPYCVFSSSIDVVDCMNIDGGRAWSALRAPHPQIVLAWYPGRETVLGRLEHRMLTTDHGWRDVDATARMCDAFDAAFVSGTLRHVEDDWYRPTNFPVDLVTTEAQLDPDSLARLLYATNPKRHVCGRDC